MSAFYNELDAFPAAWLRNLIDAGHIAPGAVDERSVIDLEPTDLTGYAQAHFFAGIGVWSYALRLAGWPDDAPVWTGSCPCQPFSAAGRGRGHEDERHLWPAWFRLIRECRPPVIFGEQVASAAGLEWLDAVRADLEGEGYAFGAADLCAAGVGAPHARHRLYFVASMSNANCCRWQREREKAFGKGCEQQLERLVQDQLQLSLPSGRHGALVDGATARVGRLRAYGNAIVAPLAAEFVMAYMAARATAGASEEVR